MKKINFVFVLVIAFALFICVSGVVSATTYYVPGNYTKIQWAVDNASAGDTIVVRDGTYIENVDVNKRLTIRSENGSAYTSVQAANPNDHVFEVTADHLSITGFTVKGATEKDKAGIRLYDVNYCIISNNNASNNDVGIYLYFWSNNTISNNNASNNEYGICLYFSINNTISNNNVSNNNNGISLFSSSNNDISNNKASNNNVGIYLYSSSNNTISNNNVSNNNDGILLYSSIYSTISSSSNNISNNNLKSNNRYGISLFSSSSNEIHLNNFINNADNFYSSESTNIWNSTSKITYTYNGSQYANYLGNYWDDYKEKYPDAGEIDETGIWDTPYSIDSDNDNYPLIEPWENYFKPPEVKIFDTGAPANPYPSIFGTHNGTIKPNVTIEVSKLYTYPCAGTGGHTEYARIWNSTLDVNATWNGYVGDWHNITFGEPFTLFPEKTYYYEVRTGSYPQIIHTDEWEAKGGMGIINCTSFVDANGKVHNDWIPAIRLE